MDKWLPTIITFLPLLFTLIVILIPKDEELVIKLTTLVGTGLALLISIYMFIIYDFSRGDFQMIVNLKWITAIGAHYNMAVDGISMPMVFLTALLTFICVVASWKVNYRVKEYMSFILFLEVGMIGTFLALDFILFYVFWEIVLIPTYFLIGVWGGPRKEYAAMKFFLYTFVGSVFMLLGILGLYFYSGMHTFEMMKLAHAEIPVFMMKLIFISMFLGFAVKVPIVPFHTWLPDAHVEAPTAVSVLLAGAMLKMGTYAFVRIGLQVVPQGMKYFAWLIAVLAVISIIYGALCAMVQKDLKKLVAYSSVSHMGYVMFGIVAMNADGLNGAVLQMFSHGVITGMLFLVVGIIYDRTHTREIDKLGGLYYSMAIIGSIWAYISLASFGLPSLAGFVGEFLIIIGAFKFSHALAAIAALGIILTAGYLLWTIQRICMGEPKFKGRLQDATPVELAYMSPLLILILIVGLLPGVVLRVIEPSTAALLAHISKFGGL